MVDVGAKVKTTMEFRVDVSQVIKVAIREGTHVYKGPGATWPTLIGVHTPSERQRAWEVGVTGSTLWHRWPPHFKAEAGLGKSRLQGVRTSMRRRRQGGNYDFAQ